MSILGDANDAIKAIKQQILLGAAPIHVRRNGNGIYEAEFEFTPDLDLPEQAAATAAVAQVVTEINSGKTKIVLNRSSATNFTITAT